MSRPCCTGNGGGCLKLVRNTIKLPEKHFKNWMYIFVHLLVVLLRITLSASCCSIFPACNYYLFSFFFFPPLNFLTPHPGCWSRAVDNKAFLQALSQLCAAGDAAAFPPPSVMLQREVWKYSMIFPKANPIPGAKAPSANLRSGQCVLCSEKPNPRAAEGRKEDEIHSG